VPLPPALDVVPPVLLPVPLAPPVLLGGDSSELQAATTTRSTKPPAIDCLIIS
jgi:hypothetical protein